jgi:hypothetical protein
VARQVHPSARDARRHKPQRRPLLVVLGLLAAAVLLVAPVAFGAQATVGMGTAGSFAVLAGSTVTNTGSSVISGNVGLDPGSAVTGFPPGTVNAGTMHVTDAVALQAQNDLTTAYNDAAGRSSTETISSDLAGLTLTSGVYTSATSLGLSGNLTLDAEGDPSAVFIFQAGSTLTAGSGAAITLTGGAQACNVFWQVGSSATIGTGSQFVGVIMALDSISMTTGATLQGSALARNGAVTLDDNTITQATCATTSSGTTGAGGTTTTTPATGATGSTTTTGATGTSSTTPKKKHPKTKKPTAKGKPKPRPVKVTTKPTPKPKPTAKPKPKPKPKPKAKPKRAKKTSITSHPGRPT